MAGENLFSSMQFSLDIWIIILEELIIGDEHAAADKLEKIHFAKKAIREHILNIADRQKPVEEKNG